MKINVSCSHTFLNPFEENHPTVRTTSIPEDAQCKKISHCYIYTRISVLSSLIVCFVFFFIPEIHLKTQELFKALISGTGTQCIIT